MIVYYLFLDIQVHSNVKLQIAAILCILNLVSKQDEGKNIRLLY